MSDSYMKPAVLLAASSEKAAQQIEPDSNTPSIDAIVRPGALPVSAALHFDTANETPNPRFDVPSVEPPEAVIGQNVCPGASGRIVDYSSSDPDNGVVVPQVAPERPSDGSRVMTPEMLSTALIKADDLAALDIPIQQAICGSWFYQGALGFLFAERGLGKTWLALLMAISFAAGRNFGPWSVSRRWRVLYVDGEMPLDTIRDRFAALHHSQGPCDLQILNHEWLFQKTNCVFNLSGIKPQDALLQLCVSENIEILILDNLSCLFSGVAENDADAWEQVLPWLLDLRRRNIAVVMVHHSGRSGQQMRGTSRREDAAFWILRLDAVAEHSNPVEGARFVSKFVKQRQGTRNETAPIEWHFEPTGLITRVSFKRSATVEEVFKQHVKDGLTSCTDIAEEMQLSKGTVSKLAKRAEVEGWLRIVGRTYVLV